MVKHIQIGLKCEQRGTNGPWAPAFGILFIEGNVFHETPKFYASDHGLTFPTKQQAEEWSESAAREWCRDRYPDYSIEVVKSA
jgi:hypothetical protein